MNKQKSAKNLEKNWLNWSDQTKFIKKHKEKLVKVVWPWISSAQESAASSRRSDQTPSLPSSHTRGPRTARIEDTPLSPVRTQYIVNQLQ